MKKMDRVCNSDNFNFRGFPSFQQVCEKRPQAARKWNVCTVMVLLHIYSKCHVNKNKVLMLIKLRVAQLTWLSICFHSVNLFFPTSVL